MTITHRDPVDLQEVPPVSHREATEPAREAYRRLAADLAALDAVDWARPTDCDEWDVRAMAGHVLGAMQGASSMRENLSQLRAAAKRGGNQVDALSAEQIDRNEHLDPAEVAAGMEALVDDAAAGRRRTPAPLRHLARFRVKIGSIDERWKLGYLVDTILTRDAWMHRVDLSRATGPPAELDAEHDGRIVADIAREWADRHGQACTLVLTGPAGGTYIARGGGQMIEIDAVEFCRILSGRAEPTHPLLETEVPF